MKRLQSHEVHAGLADLSYWSRIRFWGPDCRKFLHGLFTNDILNLKPQHGGLSCILTPKGKLLADFELYDRGGDFLALCLPRAGQNLQAEISKKIILSDSRMEDIGPASNLFYLAGPGSREILQSLFGSMPEMKRYEVFPIKHRGVPVEIIFSPRMAAEGHWIVVHAEQASTFWTDIMDAGKPAGLQPVGWDALNAARIERGVPLFGIDMDEETIPLEARLEEAISFTKGCYMGQETITRIKSMGHVNKILVRLKSGGRDVPPPGSAILAQGREVGRVTSAARLPGANLVALAMVRVEKGKTETKFQVVASGQAIDAFLAVDAQP